MLDKNTVLIELSESDRTAFGKVDFDTQSYPQKVFSSIWSLESEVNNGGFAQYFENESCETAPFVAEALQAIGAPQAASLCRRAIAAAFPNGLPADVEMISTMASDFSDEVRESLGELDNEFFQYPDPLTDLLFDYVSAHPDEFGTITIS